MNKHIEHSFSQDKMHIIMPNTEQLMRDKLADSLKEFNQWVDLIRSGEAEVTGLTVRRKRTWVGLTDEEIVQMGLSNYVKVVRETEAKLKQKNEQQTQ
jgi:hypothetical protein